MAPAVPGWPSDRVDTWLFDGREPATGSVVLDDHEWRRLLQFRAEGERERYRAAHTAARLILGAYLGAPPGALRFERVCRACGGPHGKPVLVHPSGTGLEFNFSHSGPMVLMAVTADRRVGVDIEADRPVSPHIDASTFSPSERAVLSSMPEPERNPVRLRAWTRKEAVVKGTGEGLEADLSKISVLGSDRVWPAQVAHRSIWSLHDVEAPAGYSAALAYEGPPVMVRPVRVEDQKLNRPVTCLNSHPDRTE